MLTVTRLATRMRQNPKLGPEPEKGEAVSKQRVYSALRVLVERKQLQRNEASIYQLAGNASRSRGRAA
jgi:hypothetical protein